MQLNLNNKVYHEKIDSWHSTTGTSYNGQSGST